MESSPKSGKKRTADCLEIEGEKRYRFRICLPNGASVKLRILNPPSSVSFEQFLVIVKNKYESSEEKTEVTKNRRKVEWKSDKLYLEDVCTEKVIQRKFCFENFTTHKIHVLRLDDGSGGQNAHTFENMWDLTPSTDILTELPEEYTFETALADLIDNSLQAVWSNESFERKIIFVNITEDKITILDTGPGMDGTEEHSIEKWGKLGASVHRKLRQQAVGGKPPYLKVFTVT